MLDRFGERAFDLRAQSRHRPQARPAVRDELHQPEPLARLDPGRNREAGVVCLALALDLGLARPPHDVLHRGRDPEPAALGRVDQHRPALARCRQLSCERAFDHLGRAWVSAGRGGDRLVGDQLRLDHQLDLPIDRLDLVEHGRQRAVSQGHQTSRAHADGAVRGRLPFGGARQEAGLEVEHSLVGDELAVADIERLIFDKQPDDLAVGYVDQRLSRLGIAVRGLGVGEGHLLEDRVQICARGGVRLAFVEVGAPSDVSVGEREDRLGLAEPVEVQPCLADVPWLACEVVLLDHIIQSATRRGL